MKHAFVTLLVLLSCSGCGRGQLASKRSVPEAAPSQANSGNSRQYPRLEWAVPINDVSSVDVVAASKSVWPASAVGMRERFKDRFWREAESPEFTIRLTENDFLRVTVAPGSKAMVGSVKTTRTIDSGPLRGELLGGIRTTQPFANEGEALSILEAYLKQDGTFETLVRWSNADTGDSSADASERSP